MQLRIKIRGRNLSPTLRFHRVSRPSAGKCRRTMPTGAIAVRNRREERIRVRIVRSVGLLTNANPLVSAAPTIILT